MAIASERCGRRPLNDQPFDARYDALEWNPDEHTFATWADGETGIPGVDAAMRELRATGWVGNRARMVACHHRSRREARRDYLAVMESL